MKCFVYWQSVVTWEGNRMVCIQKGEKKNRGWAQWIKDDKLHLVCKSYCCCCCFSH